MYDLSIACVYNNIEQFDRFRTSVEVLPFSVQLIALDNRKRAWPSAAAAYNHAVEVAESEVILFSHQDIVFLGESFVSKFINMVRGDHNLLVGVAGAVETEGGTCRKVVSGMYQGSKLWRHHTAESPTLVSTLDECLFGCHKRLFSKTCFDEDVCDGWHFYAVDLSLQAQDARASVMVLPADVLHLSGGHRDDSYYLAQEKLKQKYVSSRKVIVTTCGWTRTCEIDPYRPIVDDELAALDRASIPYDIRFFRAWDETGDLRNKVFLPSLSSLDGADNGRLSSSDISLSPEGIRLYSRIARVRNFFSSKRWLYEDLRDLKRDYVKAVEEEIRGSGEFQIGLKLVPWTKVAVPGVPEFGFGHFVEASSSNDTPALQCNEAGLSISESELEAALLKGKESFSSFVFAFLLSAEACLSGLTSSDLMILGPFIRSAMHSSEDACSSLYELVVADAVIEKHAEGVRRAYAASSAFRIGSLLLRMKRAIFVNS